jgi:hypothetical protein
MAVPALEIRLVSNEAQVRENHASYQKAISLPPGATKRALIDVIPYILSWVAIRDPSGSLSFAPSKFIGYRHKQYPMTGDVYEQHHQDMDGRQTEVAIRDWIRVIAKGDPGYDEAHDKLFDFCANLGKKPNGRCRVSLFLDNSRTDENDRAGKLSQLLVEVYKSLPAAQQREVMRRIKTQ